MKKLIIQTVFFALIVTLLNYFTLDVTDIPKLILKTIFSSLIYFLILWFFERRKQK